MICPKCGAYVKDGSLLCDRCGTFLSAKERRERAGRDDTVLREDSRSSRWVYDDLAVPEPAREKPRADSRPVETARSLEHRSTRHKARKRFHINWAVMAIVLAVLLMMGVAGTYLYLTQTLNGQVILIRSGREVNSAPAYWSAGEKYLDYGYLTDAVGCFETARAMDEKNKTVNVDHLLTMAGAYEANGQDEEAEAVYTLLYQELCPSRSEPYTNLIRMFRAQGRNPEAADMMLTAYQNTGLMTYRQEREQFIPALPLADLTGSTYDKAQVVHLTSSQNFDIYYTLDGTDPEEFGVLYEGEILLDEGSYAIRAVCKNGDLYSDVYSVSYVISLPSPSAPRTNLAPETYTRDQTVKIRNTEKDDSIVIYYTIDGSTPTELSPVYDGNAIKLPHGWVEVKAIAVNSYGKKSTVMTYKYKIDVAPYMKKKYTNVDQYDSFVLMKTTRDEFLAEFGQPLSETSEAKFESSGTLTELTYSWGTATFLLSGKTWLLADVTYTSNPCKGPRGLSIGMSESEVVDLFRDHGQKENPGGGRGLYTDDTDVGKVILNADGTRTVSYVCSNGELAWHLEILLVDDRAVRIRHYYSY